ncbi:MAG TPA: SDR family oxidoreductase [Polyangiales bacterium]|nr:SDR family oxidoreductase [Polyangiales bacterium]
MDLRLGGKKVLITGGSMGIGLACAHGFAAEGCELVLAARNPERLGTAERELSAQHGVRVAVEAIDLAASANAERLAERHPEIDILVNNAGAIPGGNLEAVDETTWRDAWDLKVFGFINLSRSYYKRMRPKGAGVIINVIGLAGDRPSYDYIAGTAANAALMAFTKALGSKSVDHGIRVMAVNPPFTETERLTKPLRARAQAKFGDPERWRELLGKLPFGRPAKAEEIADVVVFLASERASYMSGSVVNVDAGAASRN